MGEREMLLVLVAMLFFSMTNLSVNRFCINNSDVMMKSEFDYYAISLAQRLIEEAKTKTFDAAVAFGTSTDPPNDFTGPSSLGCRYDENYPNFNDVDDYNNLTLYVNTPRTNYTLTAKVYYVDETNPDVKVYYRTFYKKMVVTVQSDFITHDIKLNHVYCYNDF